MDKLISKFNEKIRHNVPLSPMTTFNIGGPAKYYVEIKNKNDLIDALRWAKEKSIKYFILGGGSNLLVNDKGVDGLVIKLHNNEFKIKGDLIECGASVLLTKLVLESRENKLSGLEWGVGIPKATMGGVIRGNAAAFGSSIGDITERVEYLDIDTLQYDSMYKDECNFSYRNSKFKEKDNYIIWKIYLKLKIENQEIINSRMKEYLFTRSKIQPKEFSPGCIFKNLLLKQLKTMNPQLANEAITKNLVKGGKIGAGWVIDQLGLKGKSIGGAKISDIHANFIVNTGNATADDVVMLISFIKQQVRDKLGVQLQEEIVYFGF